MKQYRHTPSAHTSALTGSSDPGAMSASGGWNAGVQLTLLLAWLSLIMLRTWEGDGWGQGKRALLHSDHGSMHAPHPQHHTHTTTPPTHAPEIPSDLVISSYPLLDHPHRRLTVLSQSLQS